MKLSILLCLCLLAQGVFPHGGGGRATCDVGQCQGRPGKVGPIGPRGIQGLAGQKGEQSAEIGPIGPRGIRGLKGRRGETGTSEEVEEKVRLLEGSFEQVLGALARSPSTRKTVCYMGMKSGQIPDSAITSTSGWSTHWAAHQGRLDGGRAWHTGTIIGAWIQVDLGQPEVVAGVVTQGRPADRNWGPAHNYWVTSYKVSCGNEASSMTTITEHGQDKVFSANTDGDTKVVNKFPQLMTCRYIRIYPQTHFGNMMLRVEIIRGICKDIY